MSVREVKAFMVTCTMAYEKDKDGVPKCANRDIGPFFAWADHEVPLLDGWGHRTLHGCGLTGYTRIDLFCGDCIRRYDIQVDA